MRPVQYLVVVAFGVFDGRLTLLAVAVAVVAVDVVVAPRAGTQEDHSFLTLLACKAIHYQRARPETFHHQSSGLSFQIKDKTTIHDTYKLHLC